MRIEINNRGNGACPLCAVSGNCRIQDTLTETIEDLLNKDDLMEIVIYSCPQFEEKA